MHSMCAIPTLNPWHHSWPDRQSYGASGFLYCVAACDLELAVEAVNCKDCAGFMARAQPNWSYNKIAFGAPGAPWCHQALEKNVMELKQRVPGKKKERVRGFKKHDPSVKK